MESIGGCHDLSLIRNCDQFDDAESGGGLAAELQGGDGCGFGDDVVGFEVAAGLLGIFCLKAGDEDRLGREAFLIPECAVFDDAGVVFDADVGVHFRGEISEEGEDLVGDDGEALLEFALPSGVVREEGLGEPGGPIGRFGL